MAHDPGWVVKIRPITVEDGLSSRFVNQIYQDTEDYMWFVTPEGLNRYDGYRMEVFTPRQMGARVDYPYWVLEDCNGHIWLISRFLDMTSGRIARSDWRVDVLDPFTKKMMTREIGLPVHRDSLSAVGHIPGRMILFGTVHGQVFGYDGGFFLLFQDPGRRPVIGLRGHGSGVVAAVIGGELVRLDSRGDELGRVSIPGDDIWKMAIDHKDGVWVCIRDFSPPARFRMIHVEAGAETAKELELPPGVQKMAPGSFSLAIRAEGGWVLSYPGFLGLFDREGRLEIDLSDHVEEGGKGKWPGNLYIDRRGALWGSQSSGVVRLTWRANPFRHFLHHPPFSIRGMSWVNDSVMFVTNYRQQLLLNVRTGNYSFVGGGPLADLGVARDTHGFFWAGRHLQGFVRFLPGFSDFQSIPFYPEPSRMPRPTADGNTVFPDSRGRLWFGMSKGLGVWDEREGHIRLLQAEPPFAELMDYSVNAFYETKDGLWIATSNGLFRMNHEGKIHASVPALDRYYIFHIHLDSLGRFWLSTRGSGLICWDPRTSALKKYDSSIGFISDVVYAVVEDGRGRFWLPTNKGLMRFDPNTGRFTFFSEADGMANSEFNYLAFAKGADGWIYLGGLAGITAFHPDSVLIPESVDIPIKVTSFTEWTPGSGVMMDKTAWLKEKGQIVLSPPIQSFHLSFALLDFQSWRNEQYAYWMENLEPGWTFLGEPEIHLSRLPPGRYILHLNGRTDNGLWSREELRIPVWVKKPFYFRPLFWAILVVALSLVVFLYYRWTLWRLETQRAWLEAEVDRRTSDLLQSQRLIREQNLQLGKLNQTKDQLFLILAHELKNPVLSFRSVSQKIAYLLNRGQLERLSQLGAELDRTASNAHKLLDNLLQWAKTQRGTFALHPRIIYLQEAFEKVIEEYRERAGEKNLSLSFSLDGDDISVWADPAALQIMLRNLVDNAVKFSKPGGHVWIEAGMSGEGVEVRVKDTGVGMTPEKLAALFQPGRKPGVGTAGERGSGLGLLLMKELMELHNGMVTVGSQPDIGTTFTLWFPPRDMETSLILENNLAQDE